MRILNPRPVHARLLLPAAVIGGLLAGRIQGFGPRDGSAATAAVPSLSGDGSATISYTTPRGDRE
jgi:hypothetical protein